MMTMGLGSWYRRLRVKLLRLLVGRWGVVINVDMERTSNGGRTMRAVKGGPFLIINSAPGLAGDEKQVEWPEPWPHVGDPRWDDEEVGA